MWVHLKIFKTHHFYWYHFNISQLVLKLFFNLWTGPVHILNWVIIKNFTSIDSHTVKFDSYVITHYIEVIHLIFTVQLSFPQIVIYFLTTYLKFVSSLLALFTTLRSLLSTTDCFLKNLMPIFLKILTLFQDFKSNHCQIPSLFLDLTILFRFIYYRFIVCNRVCCFSTSRPYSGKDIKFISLNIDQIPIVEVFSSLFQLHHIPTNLFSF